MSNAVDKTPDNAPAAGLLPPTNVIEDAQGITLYADLPGVPKDKLTLQVDGDKLIIEGELNFAIPEGMESIHADLDLPRYRRVFTLSKELDSGKVAAEIANGVLTLRIPKAAHAQPRKIEIQVTS